MSSFLNFNFGFLVYESQSNSQDKNPSIRVPDITDEILGVGSKFESSSSSSVFPDDIADIITTERSLLWDATTELSFTRVEANGARMRISYTGTGTAPIFRTRRAIGGDATTEVTITRVTDFVARIQNTAGTAWALGSVVPNDFLMISKDTQTFTSPFSDQNKDKVLKVQNVGADYIDVIDNGQIAPEVVTLGAEFQEAFRIFNQGPVKKGDEIQIDGSSINPSNRGTFEIVEVSDDYIEFNNEKGVEEIVLLGTQSIVIYKYLIGFVLMTANAPFKVRFNNQTEWAQIERVGNKAIFVGSVCAHKIQIYNDRSEPVSISTHHMAITGY